MKLNLHNMRLYISSHRNVEDIMTLNPYDYNRRIMMQRWPIYKNFYLFADCILAQIKESDIVSFMEQNYNDGKNLYFDMDGRMKNHLSQIGVKKTVMSNEIRENKRYYIIKLKYATAIESAILLSKEELEDFSKEYMPVFFICQERRCLSRLTNESLEILDIRCKMSTKFYKDQSLVSYEGLNGLIENYSLLSIKRMEKMQNFLIEELSVLNLIRR